MPGEAALEFLRWQPACSYSPDTTLTLNLPHQRLPACSAIPSHRNRYGIPQFQYQRTSQRRLQRADQFRCRTRNRLRRWPDHRYHRRDRLESSSTLGRGRRRHLYVAGQRGTTAVTGARSSSTLLAQAARHLQRTIAGAATGMQVTNHNTSVSSMARRYGLQSVCRDGCRQWAQDRPVASIRASQFSPRRATEISHPSKSIAGDATGIFSPSANRYRLREQSLCCELRRPGPRIRFSFSTPAPPAMPRLPAR